MRRLGFVDVLRSASRGCRCVTQRTVTTVCGTRSRMRRLRCAGAVVVVFSSPSLNAACRATPPVMRRESKSCENATRSLQCRSSKQRLGRIEPLDHVGKRRPRSRIVSWRRGVPRVSVGGRHATATATYSEQSTTSWRSVGCASSGASRRNAPGSATCQRRVELDTRQRSPLATRVATCSAASPSYGSAQHVSTSKMTTPNAQA